MRNYGEALQYQREIAGLSLMELGRKVGISNQNLGRWERGEVIPNIDFCVRLAEFYGISVNELLGLDITNNSPQITTTPNRECLTAEERQLVEDYRELNPMSKKLVKQTVETLRASSGNSESGAGTESK